MVRPIMYEIKMDLNVENVKAGTTIMTFVCYCFPSEAPWSTSPVWLQSRAQLPAALPAGWCHRPAGLLRFSALERSLPRPCGVFPTWVRPAHLSHWRTITTLCVHISIRLLASFIGLIQLEWSSWVSLKMTLQTDSNKLIQPQLLKHNHAVDTKTTPVSFLGQTP